MKKCLIICMIISSLLSSSSYASNIPKPSFKEFCPDLYYHKELIAEDAIIPARFSTIEKGLLWSSIILFIYPAVITYPLAISDTKWRRKQRTNKIRNPYNEAVLYWREREQSFEDSLKLCDSSSDRANCYLQVKINEQQKNASIEQNNILRGIGRELQAIQYMQAITNSTLQNINTQQMLNNSEFWVH